MIIDEKSIENYILEHIDWSRDTFGDPRPTDSQKIVNHIRKELDEVLANPSDMTEWADIIILAIDGAWRSSGTPYGMSYIIARALREKQEKNKTRHWVIPDDPTQPTEHYRRVDERESNP